MTVNTDPPIPPARALRALPAHLLAIAMESDPATRAAAVAGIRTYQEHPFRRPPSPATIAWTGQDGTGLLFLPAERQKLGSIALVPSLINGGDILDLLPARSFARWLAAQGFNVYRLRWGDAGQSLPGIVETQLAPALAAAARDGPAHVIGHCMGGTLAVAAAFLQPESFRSLTLLASPWDFHAGDRRLAALVQGSAAAAAQIGAARGVLPADWLQQGFAQLAADRIAAKFAAFSRLASGTPAAELFVAVEDWLNEGRDIQAGVAADIIDGWYARNMPAAGAWNVGGAVVDPRALSLPSLHIVPAADRLVPRESATALAASMAGASVLSPPVGHLGMIGGGRAVELVWRPVADWLHALK